MSMTAEERKEWAHDRLNNYLRDVEVGEFLNELGDLTHLEDRVCDLENGLDEVERDAKRDIAELREDVERIDRELDSLAS